MCQDIQVLGSYLPKRNQKERKKQKTKESINPSATTMSRRLKRSCGFILEIFYIRPNLTNKSGFWVNIYQKETKRNQKRKEKQYSTNHHYVTAAV